MTVIETKTLSEWLDERIAFGTSEQKRDEDQEDALGERYWQGVRVAYMGCQTKVAEIRKKLKELDIFPRPHTTSYGTGYTKALADVLEILGESKA